MESLKERWGYCSLLLLLAHFKSLNSSYCLLPSILSQAFSPLPAVNHQLIFPQNQQKKESHEFSAAPFHRLSARQPVHSFLKAIPNVKAKDAREHHDACPSSRQSRRQKVLGRLRAHEDPPLLFIYLFFRKWWAVMSRVLLTPPLFFPGGICPASHSQ